MNEHHETIRFPGWQITGEIGGSDGKRIFSVTRERNGVPEKGLLHYIEIPVPRRDLWDSGFGGSPDGQVGPFPSLLEKNAAELAKIRELNCPDVLPWEETRLVQRDDGRGWDVYLRSRALPTLQSRYPTGLNPEQTLRLGAAVCRALKAADKAGIRHGDLCPENIYVTEQGEFKLGGFGLAGLMEKISNRSRRLGWMSPEVYRGGQGDSRSDLYSLGLVLYSLLNEGRRPFLPLPPEPVREEDAEHAAGRRFRGEPPVPPCHGSDELKELVLRACDYEEDNRFQSPEEMLQAITELQEGKTQAAGRAGKARRSAPAPTGAERTKAAASAAAPSAAGKSRKGLILGGVGGAVALIAILAVVLLPKGQPGPAAVQEPMETAAAETAAPEPSQQPTEQPATPTPEPTAEPTATPSPSPAPTQNGNQGNQPTTPTKPTDQGGDNGGTGGDNGGTGGDNGGTGGGNGGTGGDNGGTGGDDGGTGGG